MFSFLRRVSHTVWISDTAQAAHLHADANVFENLVDDGERELGVVLLQVVHDRSHIGDIAILDLPDLRKRGQEEVVDLKQRQIT